MSSSPRLLLCELGQHSLIHVGYIQDTGSRDITLLLQVTEGILKPYHVLLLGGREEKEGMEQ